MKKTVLNGGLADHIIGLLARKGVELENVSETGTVIEFCRPDEQLRVKALADLFCDYPPDDIVIKNVINNNGETTVSFSQKCGNRDLPRKLHFYGRKKLVLAILCY